MMVSSCRRRNQIGFHHLLDRLDDKQRTSIFHQISDLGANLHHAPGALGMLFRGENTGKLVVQVSDPKS